MNGTKLTGLWKNTSKAGKSYLAGNLGVARLLILPNDFKEKEADPDYNVWLVPKENGASGKSEGKAENGKADKDKSGKGKGEDIPF